MRSLAHIFGVIFLVLLPLSARAQDPEPSSTGTVQGRYDRFEQKTTVELKSMVVAPGLMMNVGGEYSGSPNPPKTVKLIFQSVTTDEYRYQGLSECVLNVLADNEHFKFVLQNLPQGRGLVLGLHVETIGHVIEYADFRKIARAKKVEMRFEGIEFALTEEQSASLRQVLAQFWDNKY